LRESLPRRDTIEDEDENEDEDEDEDDSTNGT
jgi:hypothetical protein